jgi:hypothetical protein
MTPCESRGHSFQQLEADEFVPKYIFCSSCGQLVRYDLEVKPTVTPDGVPEVNK